jgi:hypothetical protein
MHRTHIAFVIQISWKHPARAFAKFIVPDGGDKVDSGTGLTYRPARLHRLAGQSDNPMPQSTVSQDRLITEASFFEYYFLVVRSAAKDAP